MKIAIVNCDQRMQQVYFDLSHDHETVLINEFTNFDRFDGADALVLPVKGITATGSIYANGKEFCLPESFWNEFIGKPIFVGIPQPFLAKLQGACYYYMQDSSVQEKNAQYTAEGVLFLLIDNTSRCIQDLHVDVIGYGACGKEITTWLRALGVEVRIIRRVKEKGCISYEEYRNLSCGDVIINTSIASLLDHDVVTSWNCKPLILDIATPDVIDYDTAMKCGIRVIKAGNLPNMVAYESAGSLIATYVRGKLHG